MEPECLWDLLPPEVEERIWLFDLARRIQDFGVNRAMLDNEWSYTLENKKRAVSMMYRTFAAYCGVDSCAGRDVDVWEHSRAHARVMTRFEPRHPLFVPPCASWGMQTNDFRSVCDVLALDVSHDQMRRAAREAPRDYYHSQWWHELSCDQRRHISLMQLRIR
tara:strand:- start:1662 stop:2150 length:489 start_codon:yes stop_codon:yes gene_type:complete